MSGGRRFTVPPAIAHLQAKLRYRAENVGTRFKNRTHRLWLKGVRRIERCIARLRMRRGS